ncbi:MAG: hypothetical protein KGK08_14775 [Acidobacteriota bacterium]|nr:hypothetical protein [Acidobacteriota bacterium]
MNLVTLRKKEARAAGLTAEDYVAVAVGFTNKNDKKVPVALLACPAGSIADVDYDVLLQLDLLCILGCATLKDHDRLHAARDALKNGKRFPYDRLVAARGKTVSRKREDEQAGVESDTEAAGHAESESSQPHTDDAVEDVGESPSRGTRSRTQQTPVISRRSTRRNGQTPARRAPRTSGLHKRKRSAGRKRRTAASESAAGSDFQVTLSALLLELEPVTA